MEMAVRDCGSGSSQPKYTVAQQNAISSAKTYLSMGSGFSRYSLIEQLSSQAGSGFTVQQGDLRSQQDRQASDVRRGCRAPTLLSPPDRRCSLLE
jgi:hypothetical protein